VGRRGFTLIEVLMAIALIGILGAAIVAGSGMLSGNRLRAAGGLVISSVRLATTRANATGRPVRIVFDLDADRLLVEETEDRMLRVKDTGDKESEGASAGAEAANEAEKEALEYAKGIVEGPKAPRARFTPAAQFESDQEEGGKSLGRGIGFRLVQTEHDHDPRTEGRAYLYFWPGGGTERAVVQLAREGDEPGEGLTVLINALTGRAKIERGQIALEEPYGDADFGEREEE
jgi:general secretion pathway protein H